MQAQTVTAAIRELSLGTIIHLPEFGPAVYYFKTVVRVPGQDDLVEKPQFSIPGRMVIREFDEVVTVIALPLEVGLIQLQRLAKRNSNLVTENAPQRPPYLSRRDKEERWPYPQDIAIGTLVYTTSNGMAVYRGILPDANNTLHPSCYAHDGNVVPLPVKKRVLTNTFPVQNAWHYLSHT